MLTHLIDGARWIVHRIAQAQALAHMMNDDIMEEDWVDDFDEHAVEWQAGLGLRGQAHASEATHAQALPVAVAHSIVLDLSVSNIGVASPLAVEIVRVASYLAAVGIPSTLFTHPRILGNGTDICTCERDATGPFFVPCCFDISTHGVLATHHSRVSRVD